MTFLKTKHFDFLFGKRGIKGRVYTHGNYFRITAYYSVNISRSNHHGVIDLVGNAVQIYYGGNTYRYHLTAYHLLVKRSAASSYAAAGGYSLIGDLSGGN